MKSNGVQHPGSSKQLLMRMAWLCSVWLLMISLAGCVTREVRRDFSGEPSIPFSESGETEMPDRWWMAFGDPGLDFYVEQALGENFDLAVAVHRLQAARALARREASDLLPDLDGVFGTDTTFGPGPTQTRINLGFETSYQVDLWGQIRSRVDAERFRADATQADYHAVALSLAASVTQTWYSLIEAYAQLELLDEQLETNRAGLKSQELRFGVGDEGGAPDVLRQLQLVESTLEQVVVARARVEVLEHQLAVLTGQEPQSASFNPGADLPELPPLPYAGLPSELLQRRPDVRAIYLRFVAADRDLASAISAQYPRLNIGGSLINSATSSQNLLRDWFLSIGSQLVAPIFDGGQRRAEVDRTSALVCQRFNELRQATLVAFQEVEDNLALERYQIQRLERLASQVGYAKQASEQLFERYIIGTASYLDYLSSIQSQQRLQREIISARLDLILIRVGLYLAIAGDFDTQPLAFVEPPESNPLLESIEDPVGPADAPPDVPAQPLERLPPVEPVLETDD